MILIHFIVLFFVDKFCSFISFPDDEVIAHVQMRNERPTASADVRRSESPVPYPLPMPAYGGYFAPMNDLLPEDMPATQGFHRSDC